MPFKKVKRDDKHPVRYRMVTVEPVLLLGMLAMGILWTLRTQYTKHRVSESYNVTSSLPEDNGTKCSSNESDHDSEIDSQIQSETSLLVMYMSVAECLPPLFVSMIVGSWSEVYGRKFAMLIPSVTFVVVCGLYLVVVYMELSVYFLIGVNLIQGLGGDVTLFNAACFTYMADITQSKPRMFRMIILETTIYAASGLAQVFLGYLLKCRGYKATFWLAFSLSIACVIWIITPGLLKESKQTHHVKGMVTHGSSGERESPKTLCNQLKQIPKVFGKSDNEPQRKYRLMIVLAIYFIYVLMWASFTSLVTIYGLGQPFCWSPVIVGYYSAAGALFSGLGMLIGGKLLGLCLSNLWIVQISFMSAIAQAMLSAVAPNTLVLLLSTGAGSLRSLASPLAKTMTADLVSENEQGVAFATLASVQSIAGFLSPLLLYSIYSATTSFHRQFTFYLVAVLCTVPMCLTSVLQLTWKNTKYSKILNNMDQSREDLGAVNYDVGPNGEEEEEESHNKH
ncbi:proton-coupled folate transporter-like [Anneissia japonica]|uniref:proton-coupled folate transporter-like n=1 Tax=Anneissia japonica TaxID=1529436 RepID=UPI001425612F|nr:proton-coupled folate transporter-like [Anneissia japonica]